MAKKNFTVTVEDKELELAVVSPNAQQFQDANIHYRVTFAKAVKKGVIVREALEKCLVEQGIWGDEHENQAKELRKAISDARLRLEKGGIKKSEVRNIALKIKDLETELRELYVERNELDANTAQGLADTAKFEYLVSVCTVYAKDGKPYFRDLDDFYSKNGDVVTTLASINLMNLLYSTNVDADEDKIENKLLKRFEFVDDKGRLINADKKLVDVEGRLVDENGRFIDENGKFVDIYGNPVDENGNNVVTDALPFLDDDGNPIEG